MKLRTTLTFLISGITLVIITIISWMLLFRARSLQTEAAFDNMKNMTGLTAVDMGAYFQQFQDASENLALIMGRYEAVDPEARRYMIREIFHGIILTSDEYFAVYVVWKPNVLDNLDRKFDGEPDSGPGGFFAPRFTREKGKITLAAHPQARELIDTLPEKGVIDEPKTRQMDGKTVLSISFRTPVFRGETEEVVGVVGVTADISFAQAIFEEKKPYGTGGVAFYSHKGMVVAHPQAERIGTDFRDSAAETLGPQGVTAIEATLSRGEPASFIHNGIIIQSYPMYIGASEEAWAVAASVPTKTVLEGVESMTKYTVIIALIVVTIAGVAIFIIATRIAKPIVGVSSTLKDISEGEGDLTRQISVNAKNEIGDLAYYFNQTLEKIRNLVIVIKNQSASLYDVGNELVGNMTESASAANEISANIQSIRGQVINQSASVTETNATMEQITVNIDRLNGNIDQQTSSVSQSSSAIEQMLANIQSVTRTLEKNAENVRILTEASMVGRKSLGEVAENIQNIARESEGLLEINSVMESIASQTNLLSMNAAIEAAHAGEAGKGFAVVADEIRKLAESSGEQSKTISAVLQKIKNSMDQISASTQEVLNKFDAIEKGVLTVSVQEENIRSAMEEQNTGSRQILDAIGQLNSITSMVKGGSTEMLEGSNEVIHESKNLEAVTQQITNGINEIATGAEQINGALSKVSEISAINKEYINTLVKEVSRFKVE
jgi:methyl-accepting chemotaxis protein